MPLVKRSIEPLYVSRTQLHQSVKNELEAVVVNSLAGLIKQLSNLSKHADGLFGELISDASAVFQRTVAMNKRVEILRETAKALDPAASEQGTSRYINDNVATCTHCLTDSYYSEARRYLSYQPI